MPNNPVPTFDEVFQRLVAIINSDQDLTPLTKLSDIGFVDTAALRVFLDGPVFDEFGVYITPSAAGSDLRSLVLAIIAALKAILVGAAAAEKSAKQLRIFAAHHASRPHVKVANKKARKRSRA
jgi:hypothetical protein